MKKNKQKFKSRIKLFILLFEQGQVSDLAGQVTGDGGRVDDNAWSDGIGSDETLFEFVTIVVGIFEPGKHPFAVKRKKDIYDLPQICDSPRLDIVIFKL